LDHDPPIYASYVTCHQTQPLVEMGSLKLFAQAGLKV
jgi:hypothetical protein